MDDQHKKRTCQHLFSDAEPQYFGLQLSLL
jgi:hypothetical protein